MVVPSVRPVDWQVLQVVRRLGATPQHKLAERIGRQRSTVNGAVQRLLSSGWLNRAGQAGEGRGRPAILLAVNRRVGCFAGIDIAAEELHHAVVGADGVLLDHASSRLGEDRTFEAVLNQIDLNLRGVLSRAGMEPGKLLGLWAGVNGVVDERGVVVTCASLGWHNEPLGDALGRRYGCDVLVQGGAPAMNAAAESLMGAGRDVDSLVYYHAGRGIAARFVQRGQPLAGATQRAGELGHVVVEPDGPKCACGNNGCLEAVASGPALVAAIRRLPRRDLPEAVRTLLREPDGQTAAGIVQAAFGHAARRANRPLAALFARATDHLAMGAAMAVAAYDPEVLVLGGYLFEGSPALRNGVRRTIQKMVLDWDKRSLKVVQAEVVSQDRAVGGAAEVCQGFWASPHGAPVSG
ncbi:MAG: ROK family transcriptional regulator [Phycisphaerales bacterium]|nr:MAG: ROK family transcriptional regulator [Phycisphaerales bacterium]